MHISLIQKAIIQSKYEGIKAELLISQSNFFKDLILRDNAEFIEEFFDDKNDFSLIEKLFKKRKKSRNYYESEIIERIFDHHMVPTRGESENLIPELINLRGERYVPIFDNVVIGRYNRIFNYRFEVIRRGRAEDLYYAICE